MGTSWHKSAGNKIRKNRLEFLGAITETSNTMVA